MTMVIPVCHITIIPIKLHEDVIQYLSSDPTSGLLGSFRLFHKSTIFHLKSMQLYTMTSLYNVLSNVTGNLRITPDEYDLGTLETFLR